VELRAAQTGAACARFLQRAVAWYARQGITVQSVMTDNAKAYTSRAHRAVCTQQGLRHLRTKPYHPQTNGKAERFIQTALRRWAYKKPYRTSDHRAVALPDFVDSYNWERPHRALGGLPPLLFFLSHCVQRP
jgi:transposase InsO family protein